MVSGRLAPDEARERAAKLVRRNLGAWAVSPAAADAARFELPLHPPTERAVLTDQGAARSWADAWRGVHGVQWDDRKWSRVGTQSVPIRLDLATAPVISRFAGRATSGDWARALELVAAAREAFSVEHLEDTELGRTVASKLPALLKLPATDARLCLGLAGWLSTHDVSGMYLRQVPLPGVDTKWLGKHRGLVTALVRAATGRDDLGLASAPERTRVRILDPAAAPGLAALGLTDVEAPLDELASLRITSSVVLVVENRETLLALPLLPGVVAVEGRGYGAGPRLAALPWMSSARVLYWGDLDSHGLAVLDQFRSRFPKAESVLMDVVTLEAHRELWIPEPSPSAASMPRLSPAESESLALLRSAGNMRLEQERIPWPWVLSGLGAALAS